MTVSRRCGGGRPATAPTSGASCNSTEQAKFNQQTAATAKIVMSTRRCAFIQTALSRPAPPPPPLLSFVPRWAAAENRNVALRIVTLHIADKYVSASTWHRWKNGRECATRVVVGGGGGVRRKNNLRLFLENQVAKTKATS